MSDADWAKFLVKFFKAKYKQNLNGKQKKAQADLAAAGIPDWVQKQKPPVPVPVTPPSTPPVGTPTPAPTPVEAPPPVTPAVTAPAVGVPTVPDKDTLEAELRKTIADWIKKKAKP